MNAKKADLKPSSPAATVALALAIGVVFFGGWYGVWRGVGQHVLSSKEYWLTLEKVTITPLPPWIKDDIREKVFSDASLDGPLSIMDKDLTDRIAEAFSLHPWVAKVDRVRKYYPAGVTVDLQYRRPVCAVEVVVGGTVQLRPVDAQAVVLPKDDFSPVELSQYPRLVGMNTLPIGMDGAHWGDPRVLGAAQITAALGEDWARLGLDRIMATTAPEPGASDAWQYELVTRRGTRVVWGRSPEHALANELSMADKVQRLKQYAAEHGSLDELQEIDVRSLQSYRVIPRSPQGAVGFAR
jgi:hypothetical protein